MLDLHNATAGPSGLVAVRDVSLSISEGEAVALLGCNGAGKTTLLRALMGLLPLVGGRLTLSGVDIARAAPERRARLGLGYVPEGRRVFPGLTVQENLDVASVQRPPARRQDRSRVFALFPDLAARLDTPAWQLSGGQQQMLALGRALMGRPRLLLLDEPTQGLSPKATDTVFAALAALTAAGTAFLLAEQDIPRALGTTQRTLILRRGALVAEAPSAALSEAEVLRAGVGGD